MPDKEKVRIAEKAPDASEEAAASKLWAVYVSEAEKYDKSLVESWKTDMEGMLIFAGLFSASLTAFIIESYKTLVPDSGASSVILLSQISKQLAATGNGSTFEVPAPVHFTPSASSLFCNALWFISLGLSLTCALIATLLEQWARDFLHKADMRSAPVIRARIFSYLYYGMKRFNMHTVVDIIPLLLHASLVFFFAGLVAFLLPINFLMTAVAAAILAAVVAVYFMLTLFPLWYLDCPYRTPLSTAFWRFSQDFMAMWRRRHGAMEIDDLSMPDSAEAANTMVEAMSRQAMVISPARDSRALAWTVKSLADDIELEPFIEGLPDVLWGPVSRRYAYEGHIQKLMRNPDLGLQSRIAGLLRSCRTGLLSEEVTKRRRITCYKALWAIASVQPGCGWSIDFEPLDFVELLEDYNNTPSDWTNMLHHSASALALMHWSTFCFIKGRLATLANDLQQAIRSNRPPDFQPVKRFLDGMAHFRLYMKDSLWEYSYLSPDSSIVPISATVSTFAAAVDRFCAQTPYTLFFAYLDNLAHLESPPYRWVRTRKTFSLDHLTRFSVFKNDWEDTLERVIHSITPDGWSAPTEQWRDILVLKLCYFWCPEEPTPIPSALVRYINQRHQDSVLEDVLFHIMGRLWSAFPSTLSSASYIHNAIADENVTMALWRVASLGFGGRIEQYETVLEAVTSVGASESPFTLSVIAILKSLIFSCLLNLPDRALDASVLPTETAIMEPPDSDPKILQQIVDDRICEARIALFAEFLSNCSSKFMPYRAEDTLRLIGNTIPPPGNAIHEVHQFRLADAMDRMLRSENLNRAELLEATVNCKIFDIYAGLTDHTTFTRRHAWLENTTARDKIKKTLMAARENMYSTRLQGILQGVDSLHGISYDENDPNDF
ncbi:hypothetical protein B0H19DRAFT_543751 [Mycena capillaripes]|nr:hypothetical protein B0H19DRAFT_543751 [Mycena capillaripes]